jgi:hypothetical protein
MELLLGTKAAHIQMQLLSQFIHTTHGCLSVGSKLSYNQGEFNRCSLLRQEVGVKSVELIDAFALIFPGGIPW